MRRFFLGLAIIAMLGIVPGKARGNDRQIARQIVSSLQEHKNSGDLTDFNIELEVENGSVYLQGRVSNEEQEQLAIEIARHIEGVRQVFNEMEIVPGKDDGVRLASAQGPIKSMREQAASTTSDSREIAERIYSRLRQEKDSGRLKGFSLDLEVIDGVANLSGTVATPEQRDLVLDVVRRVPGVKQVVNGLALNTQRASSSDLAHSVIQMLQEKKNRGELRDFNVDVQVDENIVWLSGYVISEEQRQSVIDTVRYVPGVVKVVNDLSIRKGSGPAKAIPVSDRRVTRRPPTPPFEADEDAYEFPRPIPFDDGPIGSSVVNSAGSVPAPRLTRSNHLAPTRSPAAPVTRAAPEFNGPQTPLAFAPARAANYQATGGEIASQGNPVPMNAGMAGGGIAAARFDHPQLPQYAWPSYAAYPNYGGVSYPKQYSPMAWPYIGPFYPYPQVPLGWRKATLEWKDGWWQLDFKSRHH